MGQFTGLVVALALPAGLLMAGQALADGGGKAMMHEMNGMMMMMPPAGASDATKGYVDAMNAMSMGMTSDYTGDADVDFIKGMIPHHQGAVDAARVALKYGTDPEVKAFAEKVIAAQEEEIVWMTGWLKAHGQ